MKMKENHKLRKPSGPSLVGCTHFAYEYRPNEKNDKKRIIPCICFYPAKGIGEEKLKKYASESIFPGAGSIETNSYISAPIYDGKHPLLLFSHGFGLGYEANTVQFEELASHGYIVLSIGHQDDGSYELPNGEILLFDIKKKPEDFQADAAVSIEIFPNYGVWLTGYGKCASMEEHRNYYKTIIDDQPRMVAQAEIWLKDSLAALDMFINGAGQESAMLYNHVDQENIGAFGMSFGGSTALNLAHVSDLIKASANLDGFFYSCMWDKSIKKPILLMHHDSLGGYCLTFPFLNAENDAYLAAFKNSTHGNFMDYNEILAENSVSRAVIGEKEVELAMLGEIDPNKMESIMNMLLLDFFNKYLKGKDCHILDMDNVPDDVILLTK
ncbi:hypothetical protein [Petroclostridium sp. X23]|uniref:alpha/beta hydrolase n=1 Tax=Petroclostridium sp. X23 TaxID=3045146 RepID=UPI0024AD9CBF|nr:hypothetical protein [Petroclostridium sp. X23]WHH57784.1 hypothetical protein QKW49_18460 [Petroclostridium sp. X23]